MPRVPLDVGRQIDSGAGVDPPPVETDIDALLGRRAYCRHKQTHMKDLRRLRVAAAKAFSSRLDDVRQVAFDRHFDSLARSKVTIPKW